MKLTHTYREYGFGFVVTDEAGRRINIEFVTLKRKNGGEFAALAVYPYSQDFEDFSKNDLAEVMGYINAQKEAKRLLSAVTSLIKKFGAFWQMSNPENPSSGELLATEVVESAKAIGWDEDGPIDEDLRLAVPGVLINYLDI